jgi:hypothetical protein
MQALLITPENRFIRAYRRGQLDNFAQLTMPYLAAFVREPHTVALVDEYVERVDLDAPADLVGITCNTPNASYVYRLADAFRARGCTCLFLGLESFPLRSLELANKAFNVVESYADGVARIHTHGSAVQAGIVTASSSGSGAPVCGRYRRSR